MKKFLLAITVLALANAAFAEVPTTDLETLKAMTMERLNETRPMYEGIGWCDAADEGKIECVWEIEDTGRTPDTMHGVFEVKNGEYILVKAFEEYGC
ncbi:MAG: hypothetical protein H7177_12855 [Rhizobacter sp.]|nr:hypothetical protein [Bacteriovorax sp.]